MKRQDFRGMLHAYPLNPPVRVAGVRPASQACYAGRSADRGLTIRWTVSEHDFPDSAFGRIFAGNK